MNSGELQKEVNQIDLVKSFPILLTLTLNPTLTRTLTLTQALTLTRYALVWPDAFQLVPQLQRALLEELQQAPSLEGLLAWIEVSGRVKQLESTFPNPNPKTLTLTLTLTLTQTQPHNLEPNLKQKYYPNPYTHSHSPQP